jgi:hypothetical protein
LECLLFNLKTLASYLTPVTTSEKDSTLIK